MSASGRWELTMDTPMGEQKGILTLMETGGQYSGKVSQINNDADFEDIIDASFVGDILKFKLPVKKPIPLKLHFEVTVTGDRLEGKFRPGMFPPSPVTGFKIN